MGTEASRGVGAGERKRWAKRRVAGPGRAGLCGPDCARWPGWQGRGLKEWAWPWPGWRAGSELCGRGQTQDRWCGRGQRHERQCGCVGVVRDIKGDGCGVGVAYTVGVAMCVRGVARAAPTLPGGQPRSKGPTCRNDANPHWAGHQRCSRVVLVHARVPLCPPDEAVQELAEHAVPADTHEPGGSGEGLRPPAAPQTLGVFSDPSEVCREEPQHQKNLDLTLLPGS